MQTKKTLSTPRNYSELFGLCSKDGTGSDFFVIKKFSQ
jgi:hypothetical protein